MKLQPLYADLLACKVIPNADPALAAKLNLNPNHRSIAMFTVTLDDVGSVALDEATKRANVEAAYASSFYAGSDYPSGPLSGEFIGILSGPDPEEVKSGLDAVKQTVEHDAYFESLDSDQTHNLFAHVISSTGSFLSDEADIQKGEALAYLIAPPLEAMYGLDAALKAADVTLAKFYGPPTETNFAGGLLTGSQSACKAAADAFRESVIQTADLPLQY